MLVSLRAGGTGITLHAADYVFLLDPWWNPAVEDQAIDRVHRLGQDRTVFVYRMIAGGTIEERIQRLKAEKRTLFDRIVGDLTDLTDFQSFFRSLGELVDLDAEAKTSEPGEPAESAPSAEPTAEEGAEPAAEAETTPAAGTGTVETSGEMVTPPNASPPLASPGLNPAEAATGEISPPPA
jgi:hypothetical protein